MSEHPEAITRAEAARIADIQRELTSLREFGNPLAPPDPVLVIDMRREAMAQIYADTAWGEFGAEAEAVRAASEAALALAREEAARLEGAV